MKCLTIPTRYLLLGLMSITLAAATCPSGCLCRSSLLNCPADSVTQIPNTGNPNVTIMNLGNNRLAVPVLSRSDFRHLTNLVELQLGSCGIETIQADTFIDLTKLTLLDLSFNNLRTIVPGAFSGLNLDYLFLGDNPSIILPPSGFTSMSTGVLDLKNCQLTEIASSFFTSLTLRLRKLFVNGNRIKRFSSDMLTIFNELERIRIEENPLICDCESRWLKVFYDQNTEKILQNSDGGPTDPRCNEPMTVRNEFFNRLQVKDFLCDKPTLESEISFNKDSAVLKCVSMGQPPPKISMYRPSGVIEVTFPPSNSDSTRAQIEFLASEPQASGKYKCVASNEAGNVTSSINMTWPFSASDGSGPCTESTTKEVETTSGPKDSASTEESTDVFKKKYFTIIDIIVSVFGTFAGTLIVTVVVLHVCVYRKRKSSSQYSTPPQSEYSAGSIKNDNYPSTAQQMQIHTMQNMQGMQNRPLPNKPYHKAYDENHYMSTQLDDNEDLVRLGQHNAGALVSPHSPPCHACQTLNSHRHSQAL